MGKSHLHELIKFWKNCEQVVNKFCSNEIFLKENQEDLENVWSWISHELQELINNKHEQVVNKSRESHEQFKTSCRKVLNKPLKGPYHLDKIFERYHSPEHYNKGKIFNVDPLHLQIRWFSSG